MNTKLFLFVACFISLMGNAQQLKNVSSAITWIANGGLFGDNLVSYSRTKWLSYKHNMHFICRAFPYSDQLMLHERETFYSDKTRSSFSNIVHLPLKEDYVLYNDNDTLYICRWKTSVDVDWSDLVFIEDLKKNIAPRRTLTKIAIPANCISIAAHVRTGGNNPKDHALAKATHPLRFIPDEFLIAQIKRLTKIFNKENIYLHIFTDHPQPIKLVKKFKRELNNPRITFGYRETNNNYDVNVLEDFFSMMEFDCLVRPQSNFSRFAHLLGKNKIVIYPESIRQTNDGKPEIDVVTIQTRTHEHEAWEIKQEPYHAKK